MIVPKLTTRSLFALMDKIFPEMISKEYLWEIELAKAYLSRTRIAIAESG